MQILVACEESQAVAIALRQRGHEAYSTRNVKKKQTVNTGTRYPRSILRFNTDKARGGVHPTQKPVALLEYLIKTYTSEGDTVLDNCIGSGSTAVAAINTRRNYIGFETDLQYYGIALKRVCTAAFSIPAI